MAGPAPSNRTLPEEPPSDTIGRREYAASYRRQGYTLREIGLAMGISTARVGQLIAKAESTLQRR